MLTRLSVGPVPAWQLIASIALLGGTVIIVIHGVANLFSSQYLLSGQKNKNWFVLTNGVYRSTAGLDPI